MKKLIVPATILLMLALGSPPPAQATPAQPLKVTTGKPGTPKAGAHSVQATNKTHADWHPQVRGRILTRALKSPAKTQRAKERRMAGVAPAAPLMLDQ